jgi:hypothetical protein
MIRRIGNFLVGVTPVLVLTFCVTGQEEVRTRNVPICSRVTKSHDFLFITYDRHLQQPNKGKDHVLLRLHNNSTCSVIITSGSAENFQKPLPENPTVLQRLKREIEYELPNDVLVPELQYKYNAEGKERNGIGGDSFFGFYLLPNRSISFEVPKRHFGKFGVGNWIAVPFQYAWEASDQIGNIYPSVETRVLFWTDSLRREL